MSQRHGHMKTKGASEKPEGRFGFDYVSLAPVMGGLSVLAVVVSIALIAVKGLNYGIDFAGGTEVQVLFQTEVSSEAIRLTSKAALGFEPSVQKLDGDKSEFILRMATPVAATPEETNRLLNSQIEKLKEGLTKELGLEPSGLQRVDTVGPQVGSELKRNGVLAAFYSFLVILLYIAVRFDYSYAPGAVVCLVHDALITLGVFAALGREVNIQILAAILTLIGYSINDTIVTFDRIRETVPQFKERGWNFIVNKAIGDTLGRTLLTAFTTILACLGLYLFGGGVIADLAFTLLIGVVVGTYSSIYVASPLVIVMEKYVPSVRVGEPKTA